MMGKLQGGNTYFLVLFEIPCVANIKASIGVINPVKVRLGKASDKALLKNSIYNLLIIPQMYQIVKIFIINITSIKQRLLLLNT